MRQSIKEKVDRIIQVITVDGEATACCEDGFCINVNNQETTLQIVAVVPPPEELSVINFDKVMFDRTRALKTSFGPSIFSKEVKDLYSLKVGAPRKVVVAEYTFNKEAQLKKEALFLGAASVERNFSYEEYLDHEQMEMSMRLLEQALARKSHLQRLFNSRYLVNLVEENGLGNAFVYGSLHLFNHTCRNIARKINSPFLTAPDLLHEKKFKINDGHARFNRALRDPCSFINITNLVSVLSGKPALLSIEELEKFTPKYETSSSI